MGIKFSLNEAVQNLVQNPKDKARPPFHPLRDFKIPATFE